jgi:hypothetical protein
MIKRMMRRWPFYPWLFVLYAVLFVYSRNVGEVVALEVGGIIVLIMLITLLLFGIIYVLVRKVYAAAAILGVLVITFFTYGHVANLTSSLIPGTILMYSYVGLMVLAIGMIHRARRSFDFARPVSSLNIFVLVLIAMTMPPIVAYFVRSLRPEPPLIANEHPLSSDSAERPDIYYIVLDAYSSNSHFLRDYGYDNSDFTRALEQRGFFVAYDSKTSYAVTLPSISTALNMRFIEEQDITAAAQKPSAVYYYRTLIADNAVAQELQGRGYMYIDMLSGFAIPSSIADINIDFYSAGPRYYVGIEGQEAALNYKQGFVTLLLATTSLHTLNDPWESVRPFFVDSSLDHRSPVRALMTWDEAEKIAEMPEATFTLVHIIKPHNPISFDQDGNIIEPPSGLSTEERALYFFDQLKFVNARTLEMIDTILANSSTPPIIVIQGDHGSHLGESNSLDGRATNFEILNAYYLPGQPDCITDPAIIPINSFRSVLNCYFDTDYPLLEPRYFATPAGYVNLFLFEPVDMEQWMREREANPLYNPAR